MYDIRYRGLRLIPTKAAAYELSKLKLRINDCKGILEKGYSPTRRRAKNTEEKWFDKGKKIYNVVIVRSFNYLYNEEVWLIKHVGEFTKK